MPDLLQEPPHDETKTSWNTSIVIGLFVLAGSLATSILLYLSDSDKTANETTSTFMATQSKEIASLRAELREIRKEIVLYKEAEERWRLMYIDLSLENLEIKQQLAMKMQELTRKIDESDVVRQWMDDMPFAGWAKTFNEDGNLAIIAINRTFTESYGLTKEQALGKTDFELFPLEIAEKYSEIDEKVIRTGEASVQTNDYMLPNGKVIKMRNIKWRIKLSDGAYGSAGMVLQDFHLDRLN